MDSVEATYKTFRASPAVRPGLPLAVIVGAGGMGIAIARRLGQHNRLLIADFDQDKLDQVQELYRDEGYEGYTVRCNITDRESVASLAREAAAHGPLKTLVHVAALPPSWHDWSEVLKVNVIGPRLVIDAFLPLAETNTAAILISSRGWCSVRNPSDALVDALGDPLAPDFAEKVEQASAEPMNGGRAYVLSKYAVTRMARTDVRNWAAKGARIVSVSPGAIATPMGAFENERNPGKQKYVPLIPLGREGSVLEICDAVEFLASDRASYITGCDLLVDGGSSTIDG